MQRLTLEQLLALDSTQPGVPKELIRAEELLIQVASQDISATSPKDRPLSDLFRHPFDLDEWAVSKETLYQRVRDTVAPLKGQTVTIGGSAPTTNFGLQAELLDLYAQYKIHIAKKEYSEAFQTLGELTVFLNSNMPHRPQLKTSLILDQARVFVDAGLYDLASETAGRVTDLESNGESSYIIGLSLEGLGGATNLVKAAEQFKKAYDRNPQAEHKEALLRVYNDLANTTPSPTVDYSTVGPAKNSWKEGIHHYELGNYAEAEKQFNKITTDELRDVNPATTANEAQKALKARALHRLANIQRASAAISGTTMGLRDSIDTALESLKIMPTPEAYRFVADSYSKLYSLQSRMRTI